MIRKNHGLIRGTVVASCLVFGACSSEPCDDAETLLTDCCAVITDDAHREACNDFLARNDDGSLATSDDFCDALVQDFNEVDGQDSCRGYCEASEPLGSTFDCNTIPGPEGSSCVDASQCLGGYDCVFDDEDEDDDEGRCREPL
ncbi:MAG: hypothetical protein AAF219_07215 [Myxococcota bacterium]